MAEFVQSLLGCEEHAKCFKKEVINGKNRYMSSLLGPEVFCFYLLESSWMEETRERDKRGAQQRSLCTASLTLSPPVKDTGCSSQTVMWEIAWIRTVVPMGAKKAFHWWL